ncbi:hypothetical protein [Hyphococcus sp.]|uniref:hypothetical protein n=1 Tax=Hyphococcus sp. TaxID=2038636 RepID=UPI0035C77A18
MTTILGFIAFALLACSCSSPSAASVRSPALPPIISTPNPDSPFGERSSDGPEHLRQFAFVIGDWDVDVTVHGENAQSMSYKAKWHNIWIVDGMAVFQEWRGPYVTGAEIRTYDPKSDSWPGYNYYPGGKDVNLYATTSFWNEKKHEMVVTSRKMTARGERVTRELYYDITENSFSIRSEISHDDGKTWERGPFSLTAVRL